MDSGTRKMDVFEVVRRLRARKGFRRAAIAGLQRDTRGLGPALLEQALALPTPSLPSPTAGPEHDGRERHARIHPQD